MNIDEIIKKVAQAHNTTPEEVYAEMQIALDQTEQAEEEEKLRTLYGDKHSRFQEPEALIQEKNDTKEILTNFISKLNDLTGEQTEFREEL